MPGNTFGRIFRLTTYGESHGKGLGGVVDGCPAGLHLDEQDIQTELNLRRPGQGPTGTPRNEKDQVQLLSGVFEGKTTGTPIAFHVANTDQHSHDYDQLARVFRPGHADYTYFKKYNGLRDHRGGGRSSARETVGRVAGGAIAKKLLATQGIRIFGACVEFGGLPCGDAMDLEGAQGRPYFAANDAIAGFLRRSVGGNEYWWSIGISQIISNVPASIVLWPFTDSLKALIYGLDTAGLVTVIGSLASVINMRIYTREYPGNGMAFMKVFEKISLAFFAIVVFLQLLLI